jgi:hypothetical protein
MDEYWIFCEDYDIIDIEMNERLVYL